MENRDSKRNKTRTTGIRQMIKVEEEQGIEVNKVGKKEKRGRKTEILSEQQKQKK
jgi:hypothetical protein